MLDPICMEAMDDNMGDWVEDPGVLEGEDLSWMDVTVPSEPTFLSHKVKDLDDCNDSTDDRGSDDSRGMDENDDLQRPYIVPIYQPDVIVDNLYQIQIAWYLLVVGGCTFFAIIHQYALLIWLSCNVYN